MGSPPEGSISEEDIRLPTRTAVLGRGRLVTGKKLRKEVLQVFPVEKIALKKVR